MVYPSNRESVAEDMLISYVRRIESVEDEIKTLNEDKSEIYKEAKGNGFDVKVLRKVIADRRKDATDRAEFDAIYDLYWSAVHGLVRAHVENIEEFGSESQRLNFEPLPDHDPETGEVLDTSSLAKAAHAASRDDDVGEHQRPSESGIADADEPGRRTHVSAERDRAPITEPAAGAPEDEAEPPPSIRNEEFDPKTGARLVRPTSHAVANPHRPHCQKPHSCASISYKAHCYTCAKAHADAEGFTA